MDQNPAMKIIAHIRTDFATKFGVPRQSGLVDELKARIVFEEEYRVAEAVRGLEEFSHIWVIWQFSGAIRPDWSPTVRPPRLGGNTRMGVFATRSPFRPNPIGLSCLKLEKIEHSPQWGPVLWVSGADLVDGTPIYDIKPYLPYADCRPQAVGGFAAAAPEKKLRVRDEAGLPTGCPRKNGRPCGACWNRTPGLPIKRTQIGYTGLSSEAGRCAFRWREKNCI